MTQVLVLAKAPVPGQVKTRLGVEIGMSQAAEVAASALLDTLGACARAYGADHCHLALAGELETAVRGEQIAVALAGWTVFAQHGTGFAERLVRAHADVAARAVGPVIQIGMDTPQVTPDLLTAAAAALGDPDEPSRPDAVLGPARDGGWWVLALRDPRAAAPLRDVVMSTPTTFADSRDALTRSGLRVTTTAVLRDVDTVADAEAVAAQAPRGAFAQTWRSVRST